MLDPNILRKKLDVVAKKLARRGFILDVDTFRKLEQERKDLQIKTERLQAERNSRSKAIGASKTRAEDIEALRNEINQLAEELNSTKNKLTYIQDKIRNITLRLPNLPDDSVPDGKNETDNVEINRWGELRQYDFIIKDHIALGELTDGLDFLAAVKITGSRFLVMKGQIGRLHRALAQFMLDLHTEQH
ncbi:MAG: serine--tRNA ligase, partial [Arsenophonus sp. NC-QC1-MAG3]